MAEDVLWSPEEMEKNKDMRRLYRIALDIKAGRLPVTFSKKGAELASKFEGEELEKVAFGN